MRNRAFFVFTACSESIVFEGIAFEILNLLQALRCNTQFKKVCVLQRRACNKFKRNYLQNYNDSEKTVKTKNAPFFIILPNISFFSNDCKLLDWSFSVKKLKNFSKSCTFWTPVI